MPAFETTASKKKMGLVLIGALCFVALGAWLAFFPEQFSESRRGGLAEKQGTDCQTRLINLRIPLKMR